MPIFHDPLDPPPPKPAAKRSGQLQRTRELGNGFEIAVLHDSPPWDATGAPGCPDPNSAGTDNEGRSAMLSRNDLIERIKRTKSPTWSQHATKGKPFRESPERRPASRDRPVTPLLSTADVKKSRPSTPEVLSSNAAAGFEIERPRSALHSGDFREKKDDSNFGNQASNPPLSTSPVAPWHHSFPAAAFPSAHHESPYSVRDALRHEARPTIRSRAASQTSFSSSFVFMPPTSPLVQQSNNTDLDFSSRPTSRQSSRSPERTNRRHTFSPHSFQTFQATSMAKSTFGTPAARHLRREGTFPYQAHQPRRSLTSFNHFQPHSTPHTPVVKPRRPSVSSEASPLHHAPMVGSYEESILRGRMSTTPSRPLNFVAQIGVLGKGQCKSNLRCPPHVTVPFPAVFYSYNSGNGRIVDNSPSPYVGLIDLENSLPHSDESSENSRRRRRHTIPNPDQDDVGFGSSPMNEPAHVSKEDLRRREKRKRRSTSPKAPPGGSYRIPQQGQLQIVIKNPNKTAVKLFLVPYDLSDMEPGQKTFIRQRSYSAGPIIDMPLSSRKNLGTDRPEAALSNSDDPNDRPVLRYLIHLHICCPSKGRYYLYKGVRVVFANRVPDGKEKLRNEIQLPDPRYSTYKPTRDPPASHVSSAAAQLTAEKAFRRRSAGFSLAHHAYDRMDGLHTSSPAPPPLPPPAYQFTGGSEASRYSSPVPAIAPIPFSLSRITSLDSRPVSRERMDVDPKSPFQLHTPMSPRLTSPTNEFVNPTNDRAATFDKLSRGDVGYGGNAFCGIGASSSPTAGLLAQRLRGLDVQHDNEQGNEDVS